MKKDDFVRAMCEKCSLPQKDAKSVIKAFMEAVKEAVAGGDKVQLIGFGTFESRKRSARTGKNPATGAVIEIPEATVPAFKAGKAFKDVVNATHKEKKSAKRGKKK